MSETRERIVEVARARATIAPAVLLALEAQNARWGASAARRASLDALARGAVVVVTGQQLGLFLGPLYTLWKTVSTIRLARQLSARGIAAVPLFWMQSEDHDWDEIRTVRWLGAEGMREASLPERDASGARSSIAHARFGAEIDAVLEALDLRRTEHGAWLHALLAEHHRPGASLPDAFGAVLTTLFEPYGLLTLQPRDPALAALAAPIHRRALEAHETITARLVADAARLEAEGKRVPIPVRSDCALSFFHPEGPEGPRYRLAPRGDTFALSGAPRTLSRDELFARLEDTPLALSTSALLRPALQDHLLPTAAYVGGPSEVAYAAQLPPIYDALGLTMAPYVRRASYVVTSAEDRDALSTLDLTLDDLRRDDEAALVQRLGRGPLSEELERLRATVRDGLASARAGLEAIDPGLGKSTTKTEETIEHALAKLQSRAERANAARQNTRIATLRRVIAALRPGGAPQERVHALPSLAHLDVRRVIAAAIERAPAAEGAEEEITL
ncbi:bacillithiol biosynthesis cysteine-adding enzyme BshC [Sandaracinus amylolyticus]|uniref:bacillithiol biosynthesis cysteine-adding enzyme BshC n=1 Tax=Sandaracinus amylolyticus TaxID=927083 RepID=UPI001F430725|nr:bacillithiol biosynthesis cysteine-adding enzyme BshC [Sandaracinus amylolyticus]UJR83967.1 Hypothetical protein I5071_60380 [Sandaracinus amylolyticus]